MGDPWFRVTSPLNSLWTPWKVTRSQGGPPSAGEAFAEPTRAPRTEGESRVGPYLVPEFPGGRTGRRADASATALQGRR